MKGRKILVQYLTFHKKTDSPSRWKDVKVPVQNARDFTEEIFIYRIWDYTYCRNVLKLYEGKGFRGLNNL